MFGAVSDPRVVTIQRRLNALGCGGACTPLDVDGVVGPKTTAAIRMFGQANSFSSDGTLTDSIAALVNSRGAKPCLDMAKIVIGACPPPAGSKPVTAEPTGTSKFTLPSLSSPWVIGGIALGALGIAYLLTRPRHADRRRNADRPGRRAGRRRLGAVGGVLVLSGSTPQGKQHVRCPLTMGSPRRLSVGSR